MQKEQPQSIYPSILNDKFLYNPKVSEGSKLVAYFLKSKKFIFNNNYICFILAKKIIIKIKSLLFTGSHELVNSTSPEKGKGTIYYGRKFIMDKK